MKESRGLGSRLTKSWIGVLICLFISVSMFAQADNDRYWSISIGIPLQNELLPENYRYQPVTLLFRAPLWTRGRWSFYAEPQLVIARDKLRSKTVFEGGVNGGVRYEQPMSDRSSLFAAIGAGPHWINLETSRQASGFIFSDNVEIGWKQQLGEQPMFLDIRGRFRHISNAGLQSPNGGIDNFFLLLGVGRDF